MSRTRIKVCGITNLNDALAAVAAGVDALGFVFYEKSPRNISPENAYEIIRCLPAFVTTVGLFVNEDARAVQQCLEMTGLDLLQFHGDESPGYCQDFRKNYIKAVRVQDESDIRMAFSEYSEASGILLDAYVAGIPGGTGQTFDWKLVPKEYRRQVILAGGLNEENVQDAIKLVNPYAVDVSGGVEASKGIKDHMRIANFVKEVSCG